MCAAGWGVSSYPLNCRTGGNWTQAEIENESRNSPIIGMQKAYLIIMSVNLERVFFESVSPPGHGVLGANVEVGFQMGLSMACEVPMRTSFEGCANGNSGSICGAGMRPFLDFARPRRLGFFQIGRHHTMEFSL